MMDELKCSGVDDGVQFVMIILINEMEMSSADTWDSLELVASIIERDLDGELVPFGLIICVAEETNMDHLVVPKIQSVHIIVAIMKMQV